MQLFVRTLRGNTIVLTALEEWHTLEQLMGQIECMEGVAMEEQRLVCVFAAPGLKLKWTGIFRKQTKKCVETWACARGFYVAKGMLGLSEAFLNYNCSQSMGI